MTKEWEELDLDGEVISGRELEELARVLALAKAPSLAPGQTDRLLACLDAILPAPGFRTAMEATRPENRVLHLLAVVRTQSGLLKVGFWAASLLAVFLGVLFTLGGGVDRAVIPLLAAGPPVAGLGIAYAFRAGPGMRELEQSCPLDLYDATLGRLALILAYDVALLLLGSVVLRLAGVVASLPLLVLAWLAPLCFVSWVGLHLSLNYGSWAGLSGTGGGWVAVLALGLGRPELSLAALGEPVAGLRLGLLAAGILGMVYTLRRAARDLGVARWQA